MNWTKGFRFLANYTEPIGGIARDGALRCSRANKHQTVASWNSSVDRATSFQQPSFGYKQIDRDILILARNMLANCGVSLTVEGNVLASKGHLQSSGDDPNLVRNFSVKRGVSKRREKRPRTRRRQGVTMYPSQVETTPQTQISWENIFGRWFSAKPIPEEKPYNEVEPVLEQPPVSQPPIGSLSPTSVDEVRVAPLLARANLLITRSIEWKNLVLGFEQENRYAVVDVCYPQSPVGFIAEKSNLIARQLLRQRRPFRAYITDALGNELFTVRRPFWWINSSIYAEIGGKEIGVVHRRWHLWRRIYDLYLGNKQFAVVENPGFWNWTFTLKDINGNVLAQIDRDWRGFGFEIFTDAGQYVIRFGSADGSPTFTPAGVVPELEVVRPLTLSERAIAVALAVSLDNDYFSRHGGFGMPFFAVDSDI